MGIDYRVCPNCRETYPDCGPTKICGGCEEVFCGYCDADVTGEIDEETGMRPEDGTCPVCRYDVVSDGDLLAWIIKEYSLGNKKGLAKEYKKAMEERQNV